MFDVDVIYQMLCYYDECDNKWYDKLLSLIDQENNYFVVWYNTYDNFRSPLCTTQEIINNLIC